MKDLELFLHHKHTNRVKTISSRRNKAMSCTKANIADSIHGQLKLPKEKCVRLVESLLEIIKRTLENGEDVLITGFGKFSVRDKGNRRGRNPQTGEDLMLGRKRVVTFRCSGALRKKVNRL